jgi:hypothetical protein
MPTSRPTWRVMVDRLDRTVSPRADAVVRTNLFADSVAAMIRLEAQVRRRLEHQSARVWHLYNLPTATDIRRMRGQLASMEARLRDVSERLEENEDARRAAEQARTQANGTERVPTKANGAATKPRAPRRSSVSS